jgi:RHS repeat-associated protein
MTKHFGTFAAACNTLLLASALWSAEVPHLRVTPNIVDWTQPQPYSYDSSGAIRSIGSDVYTYDLFGRIATGTVEGPANSQTYTYDPFGNRTGITTSSATGCIGSCGVPVNVDSGTNHLTSNSAAYDDAGGLRMLDGAAYTYDGVGMMKHATDSGADFIYSADDERVATARLGVWNWTIRDSGGAVLREFHSSDGTSAGSSGLAWGEDYIYRYGGMLARQRPPTTTAGAYTTDHFHLDHLGTPRLMTDVSGTRIGVHSYFPFGAELGLNPVEPAHDAKKFTGHERDSFGTGNDLDYMHARFYNSLAGRLLSPDPVLGQHGSPQTWNRYTYVANSPLSRTDPSGRCYGPDEGGNPSRRVERYAHDEAPKPPTDTASYSGSFGTRETTYAGKPAIASSEVVTVTGHADPTPPANMTPVLNPATANYVSATWNIPMIAGIAGPSVQVGLDRYGRFYLSPFGMWLGTPGKSFSVVMGRLDTPNASAAEVKSLLTADGWNWSATNRNGLVYGRSWSGDPILGLTGRQYNPTQGGFIQPSNSPATETGIGTPGVAISYHFTFGPF